MPLQIMCHQLGNAGEMQSGFTTLLGRDGKPIELDFDENAYWMDRIIEIDGDTIKHDPTKDPTEVHYVRPGKRSPRKLDADK